MCLVFIGFRIDGLSPGHDRGQSRGIAAPADDLAGLLPGPVAPLPAGRRRPRTGRHLPRRWGPGWASTRRAWPSRSPTVTTASSPGTIRPARGACWPSTCSASTGPSDAVALRPAELARGGFGGCNYLIAGRDAAFVVQAPGAGRISVVELDARHPRDDQPRPRRPPTTRGSASSPQTSSRATSRPRPASLCRDERIVVPGRARHDLLEPDPRRRGDRDRPHPGRPPRPRLSRFRLPDEPIVEIVFGSSQGSTP